MANESFPEAIAARHCENGTRNTASTSVDEYYTGWKEKFVRGCVTDEFCTLDLMGIQRTYHEIELDLEFLHCILLVTKINNFTRNHIVLFFREMTKTWRTRAFQQRLYGSGHVNVYVIWDFE